jgi:hypothetical protein
MAQKALWIGFSFFIIFLNDIWIAPPASAREWFVAPGGSGNGDLSQPFGKIQDAVDIARAGDVIVIQQGSYNELIKSQSAGTPANPITLRAANSAVVLITRPGRLLEMRHAHWIVDGLVFDGQYGADDMIRIMDTGHDFVLRNSEIRRSGRDCIDLNSPRNVLLENNLIHRCLYSDASQTDPLQRRKDAHGIVAESVRHLTVRNTEIHTFSGDAVQFDPGRQPPGWDDIIIENSHFWLAPLTTPENGFAVGDVTGENAIDLKTWTDAAAPRANLTLRNIIVHGFRNGLLREEQAAFLLREKIKLLMDGVTVFDSQTAFRIRGHSNMEVQPPGRPPLTPEDPEIRIQNAVVYSVEQGFHYDGDIRRPLEIYNSTIGRNVVRPFRRIETGNRIDARNILLLAGAVPQEIAHFSNRAVSATSFIDALMDDYHLTQTSVAIDAGDNSVVAVPRDRDGFRRPQEGGYDIGAYESCYGCIFDDSFD